MGDIAVRVENLSKLYRIGAKQESYRTFRDSITDALTAPFKRVAGLLRGNAAAAANLNETIWALKDVSFEVKKGEVVGIIGRNGAGKSTLLKILSRITEPTSGEAKVYGRVGALLEVGTGFHPELTGRENIYLNGAILGMSREEIKRKFDEIVAFAEVEKFIDTPVKHYSSGMGLRLGFAVAAHLEPEILIVDEVLAVGDAAFQKKCLGKMGEVAGEGRTVLFVSHNMAAVQNLCGEVIVLSQGTVANRAQSEAAIGFYLRGEQSNLPSEYEFTDGFGIRSGSEQIIRRIRIYTGSDRSSETIFTQSPLRLEVELFPVTQSYSKCALSLGIFTIYGQLVSAFRSPIQYTHEWDLESPKLFGITWEDFCLSPGIYHVNVAFSSSGQIIERIDEALRFEVNVSGDIYGTGKSIDRLGGVIVPKVMMELTPL